MTGKNRFNLALDFQPTDRPPHFESMFELEREAFGLQFPDRGSWAGCTSAEKAEKIAVCMDIYSKIVQRFKWDALAVYWPWGDPSMVFEPPRAHSATISRLAGWSAAACGASTQSPTESSFRRTLLKIAKECTRRRG